MKERQQDKRYMATLRSVSPRHLARSVARHNMILAGMEQINHVPEGAAKTKFAERWRHYATPMKAKPFSSKKRRWRKQA